MKGYLIKMTRNACIDLIRKRKRNAACMGAYDAYREVYAPFSETNIREHDENAMMGLTDVMADHQLPTLDMQILWLRYIDGESYKEIGGRLRISANSARVRSHRLKRKLQKCLTNAYEDRR